MGVGSVNHPVIKAVFQELVWELHPKLKTQKAHCVSSEPLVLCDFRFDWFQFVNRPLPLSLDAGVSGSFGDVQPHR